jgi:opacity protein-like surface antigen
MKRILTVMLALAFVGYLGCGANAAEVVKQGAQRLAIMGSAEYSTAFGDEELAGLSWCAAAEFGYMVCDQFELAVRGMFSLEQLQENWRYGDWNMRTQAYSICVVPKWRPALEGNISPFIGPKVGVAYVTNSESASYGLKACAHDTVFQWGAVLGADIFLGKNIALVVEYDYTQYTVDTPLNNDVGLPLGANLGTGWSGKYTIRDHAVTAGLAYWW